MNGVVRYPKGKVSPERGVPWALLSASSSRVAVAGNNETQCFELKDSLDRLCMSETPLRFRKSWISDEEEEEEEEEEDDDEEDDDGGR